MGGHTVRDQDFRLRVLGRDFTILRTPGPFLATSKSSTTLQRAAPCPYRKPYRLFIGSVGGKGSDSSDKAFAVDSLAIPQDGIRQSANNSTPKTIALRYMYTCLHVCIYIYTFVLIYCSYMFVYLFLYLFVYLCMYVCAIYIYIYVCIYIYIHIYIYVLLYICIYLYLYVCVCVCVCVLIDWAANVP